MKRDTSGLMFTENKDGSVRIEVVDYAVDRFGGHDWESWYELDKENAARLFEKLSELYSGTFEQMLVESFGEIFDTREFEKFCNDRGIKYSHMTWS